MPIQVTATQGGATANGILLRVKVLTGIADLPLRQHRVDSSGTGPAQCRCHDHRHRVRWCTAR